MMRSRWAELADGGGFSLILLKIQIQRNARLMSDGRNVQDGIVCGAAQRHIDGNGVFEGGLRCDVAGFDAFLSRSSIFMPALFGQAMPRGKHCRNRAVSAAQSQRLRDAVHRVGRVHAGTGAHPQPGQAQSSSCCNWAEVIFFGLHRAYAFKYRDEINGFVLDPFPASIGPAADKNGRRLSRSAISMPGTILSQLGMNTSVERMGHCRDFNGIGDQLPAGQRIFHAGMVHGDAVTDADDGKFNGGSPAMRMPAFLHPGWIKSRWIWAGNDFVG